MLCFHNPARIVIALINIEVSNATEVNLPHNSRGGTLKFTSAKEVNIPLCYFET